MKQPRFTLWGAKRTDNPRKRERSGKCSRCSAARDRKGRYCKACHAAYQKLWRERLKEEIQRLRAKT